MCKGGRIKVWCLISRGAGDYFSRLERILEFKQYGGRKGGKKKKVRVQWHRVGLKRAQTRAAAAQLPGSPTAGAFDSGFKAGSQRPPEAKSTALLHGVWPLDLCRWGEYAATKVVGRPPEHVRRAPGTSDKFGIFTKVKYLWEMTQPCKTFFLR